MCATIFFPYSPENDIVLLSFICVGCGEKACRCLLLGSGGLDVMDMSSPAESSESESDDSGSVPELLVVQYEEGITTLRDWQWRKNSEWFESLNF